MELDTKPGNQAADQEADGKLLPHPARDEIRIASVLHALADPVRLAMVHQLAGRDGELTQLCCRDFEVPVAKSTVTHHLRILREAGVTHARQVGTSRFAWLRRADLDTRFPGLLDSILTAPR